MRRIGRYLIAFNVNMALPRQKKKASILFWLGMLGFLHYGNSHYHFGYFHRILHSISSQALCLSKHLFYCYANSHNTKLFFHLYYPNLLLCFLVLALCISNLEDTFLLQLLSYFYLL